MEYCKDNAWGIVCDDGWDNYGAAVVCRQLGFSSSGKCIARDQLFIIIFITEITHVGATTLPALTFRQGSGPIAFNYIRCAGTETTLMDCPTLRSRMCTQHEDAAIRCRMRIGMFHLVNYEISS